MLDIATEQFVVAFLISCTSSGIVIAILYRPLLRVIDARQSERGRLKGKASGSGEIV